MTTLITLYQPNRKPRHCNAKCYNARKPNCACICQGANHGIRRLAATVKTEQRRLAIVKALTDQHGPQARIVIPPNLWHSARNTDT